MSLIHKDICIQFELCGEPFEAVGFLEEAEEWVSGEKALRRTDNGHVVRSDEEWRFAQEHRSELPSKLRRYRLATARPLPANPRFVSSFDLRQDLSDWCDDWCDLNQPWPKDILVLRRRIR